jgi:hypothetical protein
MPIQREKDSARMRVAYISDESLLQPSPVDELTFTFTSWGLSAS